MRRTALKAGVALLALCAFAVPATAETYSYEFGDSFGGSTIGGSYDGHLYMTNTPTSSLVDAEASLTGTWMGTSYSLLGLSYEADQVLGSGTADATVTYMGFTVYSKSVAKSWKWKWSKSKTVFDKSATFMVFGAPITVATHCKWEVKTNLNLALTPTGCGTDGAVTGYLKATGSAGISLSFLSGSLIVKITVVDVKISGEANANIDYLYAKAAVKAESILDFSFSASFFGFSLPPVTLYKSFLYDKTWSVTKGI